MAQPYSGTVDHPRIDVESRDELSSEATPLLGVSGTGEETTEKKGCATLVSSVGNFTNMIVGSGESCICGVSRTPLHPNCRRSPQPTIGMNSLLLGS